MGVEAARVSEICRVVGVAKGTFFFHFPTKDHVLLDRQAQISVAMARRIEMELTDVPNAKTFLSRLAAIVIEEHEALGDPELVRQINLAIVRQSGAPRLGVAKTAFGVALASQGISMHSLTINLSPIWTRYFSPASCRRVMSILS
ncbi:MAG: TetR/AcrR family transcriptional regulator [Acidobacteria bacterium]|nr:TetR/AcrR family transcriptional regulator [Acidobacteriota bacterium]